MAVKMERQSINKLSCINLLFMLSVSLSPSLSSHESWVWWFSSTGLCRLPRIAFGSSNNNNNNNYHHHHHHQISIAPYGYNFKGTVTATSVCEVIAHQTSSCWSCWHQQHQQLFQAWLVYNTLIVILSF